MTRVSSRLSFFRKALLAGGLLAVACPAYAQDGAAPAMLQAALVTQASEELKPLYFNSAHPLWVSPDGTLSPAADKLLRLLKTALYDGLDPQQLGAASIELAVLEARANPTEAALVRAELALTDGLVRYVEAMRQPAGSDMIYEHDVLKPFEPDTSTVLYTLGEAASMEDYVGQMRWMHPMYAQIRQMLTSGVPQPAVEHAAMTSLQRIRSLPVPPWERHVVIDIPGARLYMYEGDQVVDSMKIVVGKADTPTPQMAGYIRYAILNPYWNVPDHLIRQTIAPNVIRQGPSYLRTRGYEVLSDWSDNPQVIDPTTVNWQEIRDGKAMVRVRQKPGGANSMGEVKYEFPNPQGIYLHDTPQKEYMLRTVRQLSNGCVRLEDAERFGRWLFSEMPRPTGTQPEQRVDLQQPVPLYITYLTVQPVGDQLALATDPYGLDSTPQTGLARLH
jgi:murein L,D-transpeptidase YcbB/YkuD